MGALLALSVGVTHKNLCALISFAAGTLLGTALLEILPQASKSLGPLALASAVVSGYLLFYFVSRYVFHVCPACAASHFEHAPSDFKAVTVLLAAAFGIHGAMDGMAIAVGRELGGRTDLSIFLAVAVHKFPEGLALCALFARTGQAKLNALLFTLGLEMSTSVGWLAGILLLKGPISQAWLDWIAVQIGGGFLYLALHAVLNESREHSPRFVLSFFAAGIAFISLSRWIHP